MRPETVQKKLCGGVTQNQSLISSHQHYWLPSCQLSAVVSLHWQLLLRGLPQLDSFGSLLLPTLATTLASQLASTTVHCDSIRRLMSLLALIAIECCKNGDSTPFLQPYGFCRIMRYITIITRETGLRCFPAGSGLSGKGEEERSCSI